jgi:ABC-type amino acid transport substrate-binding protein
MKRSIATAIAAVTLISVTACGSDSESDDIVPSAAQAEAPEGLVEDGALTVCIDPEYAPLEYYENGSSGDIIGFDADAARALADYWGLTFATEVTTFEGLQPGLTTHRCDIIPGGLYMSEERLAVLDGVAYMNTGPALILGDSVSDEPATESDLCGLTFSVQSASTNAAIAERIAEECGDGTDVQQYPKTADTVLAVMNGKADVLIETDVAAADIVAKSNDALTLVDGFFPTDTKFGMFANKDAALTPALADALKALYDDGTLAEIAEKYHLNPASLDVY